MKPELFLSLDKVIHEKGRMAIMSVLAGTAEVSFTELRETLNMTDGNLSVHLRTLQEAGFVAVEKSSRNNRSLTTCALTKQGTQAFAEYINVLEQIVRQSRGL